MTDEIQQPELVPDLFGNMVYAVKRKKGRPPFERTEENAHKVSMLLAMGWNNDRIAGCILDPRTGKSISVPTLKRYFRPELQVRDQARDMLTARMLMDAATAAAGGNVGAMRLLSQLVEKNDAALADAGFRGKPIADDEPIGKKEKARRDAQEAVQASGPWGNDLSPGRYDS